ncbi:MAG TPA: TetR/AcrR family transcriptional regulator [Actinocrinis sp.]|nr:TetR/AcrR family transcriptional regulator [Actinocrinis sp.]HEV2346857.1 TetR/AcrR family transcriptional regulator [Actinocrinis sp.]
MHEPTQERSRTTRRRLLDAAVECLAELGWSGSTIAVVAQRAGVSRGAAQHHFPTREDLYTAAIRHVAETRIADLRESVQHLPNGAARTEALVELLIDLYTGPSFRAALHLWVQASTDDRLRERVVPLEEHVGRVAHQAALDALDADDDEPGIREIVQATLDLARGLGLAGLLTDDARRRKHIARAWARIVDASLNHPEGETGTA